MLLKETIIQLIMIISFGVGAILIVLFPILKKENQYHIPLLIMSRGFFF
ncbi:hypothetical protein [Bacillus sp. SM2101]|nr:hypothetical protein [Bacillus sp. SM2101]